MLSINDTETDQSCSIDVHENPNKQDLECSDLKATRMSELMWGGVPYRSVNNCHFILHYPRLLLKGLFLNFTKFDQLFNQMNGIQIQNSFKFRP